MTEAEWLSCTDPTRMLVYLQGKTSERKRRLFACVCYWRFHEGFIEDPDGEGLFAVELAEAYADGLTSAAELAKVRQEIVPGLWDQCSSAVVRHEIADCATAVPLGDVAPAARAFVFWVESNLIGDEVQEVVRREQAAMCAVLRDIMGNPFRPVVPEPAWLTWNGGTVVGIAQAISEERAFERLPILADALQEAGCNEPNILAHCHADVDHVCGCWVVDLLLARE
jgi:hypothetical protein